MAEFNSEEEYLKAKAEEAIRAGLIKLPKGDDYVLTEEDKAEIAEIVEKKIKPQVIEKVVEKVEIIKQPIVTKEITNEIKEVAITDRAEEIRDKLEALEGDERLDSKFVKNIKNYDDDIADLKDRTQILLQIATQRNSSTAETYRLTVKDSATYSSASDLTFLDANFWHHATVSSGSFIKNFILSTANRTSGDIVHILLDMQAGSETVKVYNSSVGGTQLFSYLADGASPSKGLISFIYTGSAWEAYSANIMSVY